jgi:hypothetical protein
VDLVITRQARAVVKGTEATSPIEPTRVWTISTATVSVVSTWPNASPDWVKMSSGNAAAE